MSNDKENNSGEDNTNQGGEGVSFKTVFGLNEEVFVRTVAKGNYTPSINEIDELVIKGEIKFNELRLLTFIKGKTISFRNTHTRMTRRDVYETLGMAKPKFYDALKGLISKEFILEKHDKDDYYFYALNPKTFGGVIVLRSVHEAPYRLNINEKRKSGTLKVPNAGTKKGPKEYQKGTDLVTKRYPDEVSIIRNYSAFGTLKYILLKYILLNGLSAQKAEMIGKLFDEVSNPEWMIKQFSMLLHKEPLNARGIAEEVLRAHRECRDANGKPLKTNAIAYVVTCWDQVKHHWNNINHSVDMSPEAVESRKEHLEVIQAYPIESNVVKFPGKAVSSQ